MLVARESGCPWAPARVLARLSDLEGLGPGMAAVLF